MDIECYPEHIDQSKDAPLYFVEFHKFEDEMGEEHWTLFKRNFFMSAEEWKAKGYADDPFHLRECHPWNLGGGIINPHEQDGAIDMNTKRFLRFMVDSMNAAPDTYETKMNMNGIATGAAPDTGGGETKPM